jgi:hypothetical protein
MQKMICLRARLLIKMELSASDATVLLETLEVVRSKRSLKP